MRSVKKATALALLARMRDTVKKLPDNVRIGRLFVVNDGQGLILEEGFYETAEVFGKTVETVPGFSPEWKFLRFKVGDMTIFQITDRARTDRAAEGKVAEKEMEEIVRCRDCVKRGTPECAMNYRCSVCGGQWSWETDNDFCSMGRRK